MAEFVLRYADPRGQMHEQVADATNEREARERLSAAGFPCLFGSRPKISVPALRRTWSATSQPSISKNS